MLYLSWLPQVYKVKFLQLEAPQEYGRIKCSLKNKKSVNELGTDGK